MRALRRDHPEALWPHCMSPGPRRSLMMGMFPAFQSLLMPIRTRSYCGSNFSCISNGSPKSIARVHACIPTPVHPVPGDSALAYRGRRTPTLAPRFGIDTIGRPTLVFIQLVRQRWTGIGQQWLCDPRDRWISRSDLRLALRRWHR